MNEEKVEKIEQVEKVSGAKQDPSELIVEEPQRIAANPEQFQSLMHEDATKALMRQDVTKTLGEVAKNDGTTTKASLMDQVRDLNGKVNYMSKATPAELAEQARTVVAQIEDVKAKLAAPNLELKGSVQTLLKNKLSHIDESLKVALNRAGVEYVPPQVETKVTNPIEKFLGYLTHGQYQLNRLATDVEEMHRNNKEISPANMLAIQIKVGYVTQEVEFFINLLNSALSATKTVMNVQV